MERRALLLKAWLGYAPAVSAGLVIAYAIQVYAYYRDLGGSVSALDAVGIAAVDIALWLLLSPAVVVLYTELAGKWPASIQIAVQIPAAFLFAALHVLLDGLVNVVVPGTFFGSYTEFMQIFFGAKLFVNVAFYLIIVLVCTAIDYRLRLAGLEAQLSSSEKQQQDLMLHDGHRRIRVPLTEILWFEAVNNYIGVHTLAGTEIARETLAHLNKLLPGDGFARVHRSAIVNLRQIREWQPLARGDGQLTLSDGSTVRVSRRYRSAIQNWLHDRSD